MISLGALNEPWAFVLTWLSHQRIRTLQRAQTDCWAGGSNFFVCASEWKPGTPNTCWEKDGLDNILFSSFCSHFLFVLHPFVPCVFPLLSFGLANQVKYWSRDLSFWSLSSYTGKTRVTVAKRTILAQQITQFMEFLLLGCTNGILGPAPYHVIDFRRA